MLIQGKYLIDDFVKKQAGVKTALQRWVDIVEAAEWKSHIDIKALFPAVDYVGNGRYVFNIKGNNYRLVSVITFVSGLLIVRFIGTHAEYDKIDCRTI
ncbi:MAG: type II toxin-antitoxin system HigB family toxin [Tannerellaceae bacterium]|jgi:mRNA interferase HigB|nr:type II toxin-antitoxin system HigB family toxin [Tannerellaceae bacterium]